ncbi:MAG: cohesin domain-containing protein, partial [Bacteroidota bacterium]
MKSIRLVLLACFALYSANLTAQALETSVQEVSGRPGDTVTVDVQVTHFSDITSLSGSLTWDSAVANYVGFAENTSLSTNGTISFFTGLPGQGNIPNNKITWIYTNTSTSGGVTLPDGDFIIQVQLEIIGQPLDTAELALDNSPPTAQFTRFDSANPTIPITQSTLTTNGQLTVREPRIVQTAN